MYVCVCVSLGNMPFISGVCEMEEWPKLSNIDFSLSKAMTTLVLLRPEGAMDVDESQQ